MRIRRLATIVLALMLLTPAVPARAATLRDIIELTKAGLGEEVLLALIEVERSIYVLSPAQIRELKQAGVSEKVIVAMIRSARTPVPVPQPEPAPAPAPAPVPEPEPAPRPEPQVIVIDHHDDDRRATEQVVYAIPVYGPVVGSTRRRRVGGTTAPVITPYPSASAVGTATIPGVIAAPGIPGVYPSARQIRQPGPEYWGWGGKPRPDAWKVSTPQKDHDGRGDRRHRKD